MQLQQQNVLIKYMIIFRWENIVKELIIVIWISCRKFYIILH